MMEKIKILFVCTANKMRSKTAEEIYKNDKRFSVKSAGVADFAEVQLDFELLLWADYIIVMEKLHRQWIHKFYPSIYSQKNKNIICLNIPDIFDFMDPELIMFLQQKFENAVKEVMKQ